MASYLLHARVQQLLGPRVDGVQGVRLPEFPLGRQELSLLRRMLHEDSDALVFAPRLPAEATRRHERGRGADLGPLSEGRRGGLVLVEIVVEGGRSSSCSSGRIAVEEVVGSLFFDGPIVLGEVIRRGRRWRGFVLIGVEDVAQSGFGRGRLSRVAVC